MHPADFGLANFHNHKPLSVSLFLTLSLYLYLNLYLYLLLVPLLWRTPTNTRVKSLKGSEEKAVGLVSRNDSQTVLQNLPRTYYFCHLLPEDGSSKDYSGTVEFRSKLGELIIYL